MKIAETTINETKVRLVAVEAHEKASAISRELGLSYRNDDYNVMRIGRDYDDFEDFADVFPESAKAVEATGVDVDSLKAIIEIRI